MNELHWYLYSKEKPKRETERELITKEVLLIKCE